MKTFCAQKLMTYKSQNVGTDGCTKNEKKNWEQTDAQKWKLLTYKYQNVGTDGRTKNEKKNWEQTDAQKFGNSWTHKNLGTDGCTKSENWWLTGRFSDVTML